MNTINKDNQNYCLSCKRKSYTERNVCRCGSASILHIKDFILKFWEKGQSAKESFYEIKSRGFQYNYKDSLYFFHKFDLMPAPHERKPQSKESKCRKVLFCSACKTRQRASLKCNCIDANPVTIADLVKGSYEAGDTALQVRSKVNDLGFDLSERVIYDAIKSHNIRKAKSVENRKQEAKEYISNFTQRPYVYSIARKFRISNEAASEVISEKFGRFVPKTRQTNRQKELRAARELDPPREKGDAFLKIDFEEWSEEWILQQNLIKYRSWEDSKTFPMPLRIIEIAPMLKNKGLIK
jgi:hypothetical protein